MKRFTGKKIRLGDLLIDQGVITGDQLLEAIGKQEQTNERLGAVLTGLGFASEAEIAKALQRQFGYEIVNLYTIKIGDDIRRLVTDGSILKKHVMIPFEYTQGNAGLNVAMADPMDLIAIDDLSNITNMIINPVISTTSDIMKAIDKYYGNDEVYAVAEAYSRDREQLQEVEEESEDQVNNAPIVTLMRTIIEQAVRQRASDIHIEPLESHVRVRYRIDGCLIKMSTYPTNMLQAMIARIKVVAGMDISEKRKPQDGRMVQIVDRKEYDIRVSTLPTVYGGKSSS